MDWDRVGKYRIQSGEYSISRTQHSGDKLFTAWRGAEALGIRARLADAKALAESDATKRNGNATTAQNAMQNATETQKGQ